MTTINRRRPAEVAIPKGPSQVSTPKRFEVRCRYCGTLIGFSATDRAKGIACTDPLCTLTPPYTQFEERDGVIQLLMLHGRLPQDIAPVFGLTRQRVVQILAAMRNPD